MLTAAADHSCVLPQHELVYIAFRLCFLDVATEIDFSQQTVCEDEGFGFLQNEVPFFRQVPPLVQLDLLSSLWMKYCDPQLREIYLAEAAVLYAICRDAGRIAEECYDLDIRDALKHGPLTVAYRVTAQIREELEELFDDFWDDEDFLLVGEAPDREPLTGRAARQYLGIPEEWVDEMFAVLGRLKPSPHLITNLRGLLTDDEMETYRRVLGLRDPA